MLALVAERARRGPRLDDELDAFLEQLSVESRVGVVGELLGAGAAHPSGDQASARDEIDHREFFRQAQRIGDGGDRIAEQDHLHPLGNLGEDGSFDIHHGPETKRRAVMLVEHHAIEIHQLGVGVNLLVEILVEQFRPVLALEKVIGGC